MIKKSLLSILVFCGCFVYGQTGVGINTNNPEAALHIKLDNRAISQKALSVSSEDNTLKFNLDNTGILKFGAPESSIPIDLRTNLSSSIMRIGDTPLSAQSAQEGALKYNKTSETLECSNGEQWLILNYDTPPDHVIAVNNYNLVPLTNNQYTYLTNWDVEYDSRNSFDATSGNFTVPVTGMYILSFSVFTNRISQPANSYFQGEWVLINGSDTSTILQAKNQYSTAGTYMLGVLCTGTIRLNEGDIIAARVIHNSGTGRNLRVDNTHSNVSDRNFNALSIIRILE